MQIIIIIIIIIIIMIRILFDLILYVPATGTGLPGLNQY